MNRRAAGLQLLARRWLVALVPLVRSSIVPRIASSCLTLCAAGSLALSAFPSHHIPTLVASYCYRGVRDKPVDQLIIASSARGRSTIKAALFSSSRFLPFTVEDQRICSAGNPGHLLFVTIMASAKDLWTTMTSGDVPASPASVQSLLDLGMGGIPALDQQSRSTLTRKLLADISSKPENRMTYLKALKELSRLPGGSNAQAEVQGLRTLLEQVRLPAPSVYRRHSASAGPSSSSSASHGGVTSSPTSITGVLSRAWHSKKSNGTSVRRPSTESGAKPGISGRQPSSENEGSRTSRETATPSPIAPNGGPISTSHPQQYQPPRPPSAEEWEATDIALRCLNNALFLHESSRRTFTDDSVGGGARRLVGLLKNPAQTPTDVLFLAGRLLFYATLFEPKFNKIVVEEEGIVQDLCEALAVLTAPQLVNGIGTAPTQDQMKAAQSELLKVIFNVSLYYSTSQDGEAASGSKADVAQEPLLE